MPRGKAPFSLQKRPANKKEAEKKRDGKKYRYVYYVQFRDQLGDYTSAISTGESSEGAARAWVMEYLRKGNVPTHRGNTFAKYTANIVKSYLAAQPRNGCPGRASTQNTATITVRAVAADWSSGM